MKFKEIKDLAPKELELKLRQNKAEQMELRNKRSAGTLEKSHTIRLLRKDCARILTALNAHLIETAKAARAEKLKATPIVKTAKVSAKKLKTKAAK